MTPSDPVLSVHHLAIVVADLERSVAFYAGVLGLPILARHASQEGPGERAVWVGLGAGAFLALERGTNDARRRDDQPGLHCVALRIQRRDRDAWADKLADAGHPVVRETAFTLYVRDPDGVLVGLSHHPEARDGT